MDQPIPRHRGLTSRLNVGTYYAFSGEFNLPAPVITLLVTCAIGAMCAVLICAVTILFTSGMISAVACSFSGAALGLIPARLLMRHRVRNPLLSLTVVGLATVFSSCFLLVILVMVALKPASSAPAFIRLLAHPNTAYETARDIHMVDPTDHPWSHQSDTLNGMPLATVWLHESMFIFGSALVIAARALKKRPYCEKCNRWCSGPKLLRRTVPTSLALLKSRLEAGDFGYVAQLPLPVRGFDSLEFVQYRCESCWQLSTLSVISWSAKGSKKERKRVLIRHLLCTCDELNEMSPWVSPDGGRQRS